MVRTPNLTVIGDQSAATLRDVAIQIEQFRAVVAGLIPNANRPMSLPTIVFVFGERKSMQPFVPLYNGKPIEVCGYFRSGDDANVMLLSLEGFEEGASIVYHDVHAPSLVQNVVCLCWRGWAKASRIVTTADTGWTRTARVRSSASANSRTTSSCCASATCRSPQLIAVDHSSALCNEGSKRSIFYAESWALTHYAMDGNAERRRGHQPIHRRNRRGPACPATRSATPSARRRPSSTSSCGPTSTGSRSPSVASSSRIRVGAVAPAPPRLA